MRKLLNWLNGVRVKRTPAVAPLPQGDGPVTKYHGPRTKPLSEKIKAEYRRGRDGVIKEFKDDE